MTLFYYHGCLWHGCHAKTPCSKHYQREDKSIFGNSYQLIRKKFDSMIKSIRRNFRINDVVVMPECQYLKDRIDPTTSIGNYLQEHPPAEPDPDTFLRGSMRGGRVEAYIKTLSLGPNSNYEIVYDDINSLKEFVPQIRN